MSALDAYLNKIICGNALTVLREMPDNLVNCVITSPPYWRLRDYGVEGQLGLEKTPEEYVQKMVDLFREVRRVLRDDGTCWINLGDSYSSGGIISNFTDCFNRVMEGGPVVIGHTATIGITAEGVDVSLDNKGFPYGELLSLFGIERVIVKQRDNDFCQVLYTLTDPCYCWIGVPALSVSRNMADLEIIFYSGYDISIIITEHNSNSEPKLRIPAVGSAGAGVDNKRSFAIKEPCKPITEVISDGETIGDIASLDATPKRLPNIYFIDEAVSFGNGLNPRSGDISNFRITKATLEQFNFSVPDSGFNVAVHGVSHFYTSNMYGSFIHYNQLYHKAEQLSNEMQSKQELGVPEMVKRALMRDGWICRSTIIWHKRNAMPESAKDRPTRAHEYLFLLSKSRKYYYDYKAIMEPASPDTHARYARGRSNNHKWADGGPGDQTIAKSFAHMLKPGVNPKAASSTATGSRQNPSFSHAVKDVVEMRNKRTVWDVPTSPFKGPHYATFPPDLIKPCILAGCPEGGIVLDPFMGAGTTGVVAKFLERDYVGIELNPRDVEMAEDRIAKPFKPRVVRKKKARDPQMRLFGK